jgi:putative inorganic carbon (HCO3(-)) transporter
MTALLLLSAMLLVAGAVGVLVLHASSALLLSLGVASAVFAGNTKYMGFPIPPDRLLVALGVFLLLIGVERRSLPFRLRFRSQHALMLIFGGYAIINSVVAGTLTEERGIVGLFDRLSITAWVLFSVAPLAFYDRRTRNIFLTVMVCLGGYLGVTAILEGVGLKGLAFPSYINDPNVGIHFDRARGPMTEAAGFGLAMFECAVVAVLASRTWTGRFAKVMAWIVAGTCLLGTLFTLTRAVWIGVGAGLLVVCVISKEWRRRLAPAIVAAGLVLLVLLSASSSLTGKVSERSGDARSVWDRLNIADAGLRAIEEHPTFGVGWRKFMGGSSEYFRLLPDIPQTGTTLDVHNVLISMAAELGLVGMFLWIGVVGSTVFAAMFWRPPPELEDWRLALVATGVQWAIVGMFTPFAYTFSMFFMFTLAGIVAAPRFVQPRPSAVARFVQPRPSAVARESAGRAVVTSARPLPEDAGADR